MATTTTRRAPRYSIRRTAPNVAELTVHAECWLGEPGQTRTFWVPPVDGGYVRETSRARPGTLGRQVCDRLASTGSTLSSTPEGLLRLVRAEAAACLREEARRG